MSQYDGIIIGGGPNGLTLGCYLAKAGLRVLILEKRYEMGGGLCSEMVTIPGFIHNTHAIYHPMVDYAPVFRDLELERDYDLRYIHPELVMAMPFEDGRSLCIYSDVERTCASFSQFSGRDAEAYRETYRRYQEYVDLFLAPATYEMPKPAIEQVVKLHSTSLGREISALSERKPIDIIDGIFEDDRVRALMLYATCMWGLDYDLEGLGYLVPLMVNRAANYRLCVGGSHHMAHLMYKFFYRHGGRLLGSQVIRRIIVEGGVAKGVELEDGTVYEATKFVASSIDPYQTFLKYIGEENLPRDLAVRVKDWKWERWSLFDVHLALFDAPQFKAASLNPDLERAFIYVLGFETEGALIEHFKALKGGEIRVSGFNCCFPTLFDPSEAPVGRHTGLISEHAPYRLRDGGPERWYQIRQEHAGELLERLRVYAPNMTEDNILWTYIASPLDIENKFSDMVEGSIKQGGYYPLQMGYLRPNELCSQYATPIKNLYVCGASTFPGGLVTYGAGYNAANRIAQDLGLKKWWREPEIVARAKAEGLL